MYEIEFHNIDIILNDEIKISKYNQQFDNLTYLNNSNGYTTYLYNSNLLIKYKFHEKLTNIYIKDHEYYYVSNKCFFIIFISKLIYNIDNRLLYNIPIKIYYTINEGYILKYKYTKLRYSLNKLIYQKNEIYYIKQNKLINVDENNKLDKDIILFILFEICYKLDILQKHKFTHYNLTLDNIYIVENKIKDNYLYYKIDDNRYYKFKNYGFKIYFDNFEYSRINYNNYGITLKNRLSIENKQFLKFDYHDYIPSIDILQILFYFYKYNCFYVNDKPLSIITDILHNISSFNYDIISKYQSYTEIKNNKSIYYYHPQTGYRPNIYNNYMFNRCKKHINLNTILESDTFINNQISKEIYEKNKTVFHYYF